MRAGSLMSIDMSQFHQVFFEESFEGLDIMESGLLNLDMGDVDSEDINTIFRAAHSIKGGSGTFGFSSVSDFTHVMETLLDEMRDGRRKVSQLVVNVLLGSVDCLKEMLTAIQSHQAVDDASVAEYQQALEIELYGADSHRLQTDEEVTAAVVAENRPDTVSIADWHIAFTPYSGLLKTGNDPVRMFRELGSLGKLTTTVDFQGVPDLEQLNPEACYLSWVLEVSGQFGKASIDEVFDWLVGDCDLAITPLTAPSLSINHPPRVAQASTADATNAVSAIKTATATKKEQATASAKISSSIRVDTGKIDTLINMVGELVITQSMLSLVGETFAENKSEQLKHGLSQLERHTRELQESVMHIRMLPINFVFSRFPRLVHDLSTKLAKKIELVLVGEHTEVDKTVVELLSDPLVHLVRNSLDHGIEMPADRVAAGKPETGTITLEAYHRGGKIVIEVKDDGKGLNQEVLRSKAIEKGLIAEDAVLTEQQTYELIFMAGFSTAEKLTDVSGRGVGMDVVRRNIQALGGNIEISSELGKGSTIAIHLPLTLAILDGQSIAVGEERFIIPLAAIVESVRITNDMINRVAGKGETFRLRDEYLPIIRMHEVFDVKTVKETQLSEGLVVVVDGQGMRCGLFIDDLLGQQQVVIKSLEANYRKVDGVSGATILGDGSVALILDIPGLVRLSNQ